MRRQLVCGVAVLVLALAAVVPAARGDPALGYSIENDQLNSQAAKERAVAKLSNGPKQESWWQLGESHWKESALEQFFAGSGNKSNDQHLVDSLKQSATAVYKMGKSITGIGRIEASLWTLMFQCIDPACSQGMVPLVVVPRSTANESEYDYAPLLLPVTASLLVEAIPSSFTALPYNETSRPNATQFGTQETDSSDLSLTINVRTNLSTCPRAAVLNCRSSLLDSAYGLLPGYACVEFERKDKQTFRLLVSEANPVLLNGRNPWYSVDDILSLFLDVSASTWQKRPIEECYDEPLVLTHWARLDEKKYSDKGVNGRIVRGCYNESCMYFEHGNVSCGSNSNNLGRPSGLNIEVPSVAHALFKSSCSRDVQWQQGNGTLMTCRLPENLTCSVVVYSDAASDPRPLFSPLTNWSITEDKIRNTMFQPTGAQREPLIPCIPPSSDFDEPDQNQKSRGQVLLLWQSPYANNAGDSHEIGQASQAILIRATAYLRSYIAEHNVAFTTAKGPAIDLYTFVALIVSTALSVIPAVPWPFTNYFLKQISKRFPRYLCSPKGHRLCRGRVAKMSLHVVCNTILSLVFFLPVLSMAINEVQRGQPFYTWDLGSSDLDVALDSKWSFDTQKLRVVYLFSATSKYDSQFLTAITTTVSLTCFIVVMCTIRRCMQIFCRYDLLECTEKVNLQRVHPQSNSDPHAKLVLRAFKAVEMPDSEYLCLALEKSE